MRRIRPTNGTGSVAHCASDSAPLCRLIGAFRSIVLARCLRLGTYMQTRPLLLLASMGLLAQLVAGCGGSATQLTGANAGSGGSEEAAGSGNASGSGASSGAGSSGGSSPEAGSAGAVVAWAGAGGATLREPAKHRPTAAACDRTRATNEPGAPTDPDFPRAQCHAHAECTAGENGRCVGNGHDGWACTYDSCFADSDCNGGTSIAKICECEGGSRSDNNVCLPGNCAVDADCGTAGYCSPTLGDCGNFFGVVGYFCHTPADECVSDSDCGSNDASRMGYCAFKPTVGHWQCSNTHCVG